MARSKAASLVGDFKTEITTLTREVEKKKKQLDTATALFERTRAKLGKAYDDLMELVEQFAELKVYTTKKAIAMKKRLKDGRAENTRLKGIRDGYKAQIDALKDALPILAAKLMLLYEQEMSDVKRMDEIVTQVFSLNEAAVQTANARDSYLERHVFASLIDEKSGKHHSQITYQTSDGLRKVVAMVNTITSIQGDLATKAQQEIQSFEERIQERAKIDPTMAALFDILRQLMIEKTKFKVGPELYKFLLMNFDTDFFPDLARAQTLLRLGLRSEKTNSYARISKRKSRTDNWEAVPQS